MRLAAGPPASTERNRAERSAAQRPPPAPSAGSARPAAAPSLVRGHPAAAAACRGRGGRRRRRESSGASQQLERGARWALCRGAAPQPPPLSPPPVPPDFKGARDRPAAPGSWQRLRRGATVANGRASA